MTDGFYNNHGMNTNIGEMTSNTVVPACKVRGFVN